jgi:hypothetical protein
VVTDATQRQLDLLEKEDWRFHAIGPGGTGLMMIATSERPSKLSKKVQSFALPSAPALFLNLALDARKRRVAIDLDASFVAHPTPQGIWPEEHGPVFDYFQEFSAEVVFSFTSLEAFANECIPADFSYELLFGNRDAVILTGPEIERQVSLDEKLKSVLPKAHSIKSPSGTKSWQNYKELKKVRDRLVHLKSVDRRASGPENQTIWGLMLTEKEGNFPLMAHSVMGAFPKLVKDRRWYQKAKEKLLS